MTTQIEDFYKSDRKEIEHLISAFMFMALFNLVESLYDAFIINDTSLIILFYVAFISCCVKIFYEKAKYQKPNATNISLFLGANHLCITLLCLNTYLAVKSADLILSIIDNLENGNQVDYVEASCYTIAATIVYSLICHIEKKQNKK